MNYCIFSLIALFSGALLTLSFAPFHVYSMAFIMPAILLFLLLRTSETRSLNSGPKALWLGWLFGLGFFGTSTSWVYVSIHQYGGASAFLSILITFALVAALALFPATMSYVFRLCFSRLSHNLQCLLIFPVLWTAWEVIRSVLFTGFPWVLLGYTQLDTPLRGLAPIIGVYGLTFITVFISGGLNVLLSKKMTTASQRGGIIAIIGIFGSIGLGWAFDTHLWTKPAGNLMEVSLIQGNIPQSVKWDPSYAMQNIQIYNQLTIDHIYSRLVVWPEGALPIYANDAMPMLNKLSLLAKKYHSHIVLGAPIKQQDKSYNGLLMIGGDPTEKNDPITGIYLKRHLVPFGEYIPLRAVFQKIMNAIHIPMSGFDAGPADQSPLKIGHVRIAPFICYEIAFQHQVITAAKHTNILLTISDDSWFGKSIALAQHLQMAQMRSLETGRPQLLDTNTGITAFISPLGVVERSTPIDQRIVINRDVQPMEGKTPLMRWM